MGEVWRVGERGGRGCRGWTGIGSGGVGRGGRRMREGGGFQVLSVSENLFWFVWGGLMFP